MESSYFAPAGGTLSFDGTESSAADVVCFSHLRWHFVMQRPQHLLTRAARTGRVFFWEEPVWHEKLTNGAWLEVLEESASLRIMRPHLENGADSVAAQRKMLAEMLERFAITGFVRWYYTAAAFDFSEFATGTVTVYDCMDELSNFLGAPAELRAQEQRLFQAADVVFTGGMSLYEAKQAQHAHVFAFPSSVDVEHFRSAQRQGSERLQDPADQAKIAHPRAGFYGVVDERFDVALLADAARLRPEVQFVILGPVVKIDPELLPRAGNIHYLGGRSYAELPAYLAGWDVALLPFALNAATRFISPTKTPEYLAAGKPVVSTPIHDVVLEYGAAGLVAIAKTVEEFARAIDAALLPPTDGWRHAVARKLALTSWDATWAAMQGEIQRAWRAKQTHAEVSRKPVEKNPETPGTLVLPAVGGHARRVKEQFDYLVTGAGFAGCVLAERLATQSGKRVLVIDKRDHIGGNAYDCLDASGILVHRYGPHIFHTNSEKVVSYLSQFTEWRPYEHRVLSSVDGMLLPVPINLNTINGLYGLGLDGAGMERFLASRAVRTKTIRTSEDVVMSRVGRELYEKFFRNYTRKQWGLDPSELDASVAGRIPVRYNHDDRYFDDSFQAMPRDGYTKMFERMLDQRGIVVRTGTTYQDARRSYPNAKVVYTGPIDEFYQFRFGALPYRSLEFRHETHERECFQKSPVINYPNEHAYTRVTEFKYLTGQRHAKTSIVYEYPRAEGDPYYPIPRPENAALYRKYQQLAEADGEVQFCGRLANYRYFNMDQVVAQALGVHERMSAAEGGAFVARASSSAATSVAM